MNEVIKSPTPIPEDTGLTVFLAGPMKGTPKWQRTVPKLAASLGIDVALFWVPNQETPVEGRDYAQTTRMELLENLALGKKVILGIDTDIRAADYMRYKARHYGVRKIHKTLEGCLGELKAFIADNH